jgi:hypothetical protein
MPLIFFILAFSLFTYADKEPSCIAGGIIFSILGAVFFDTGLPEKKESLFKKKKR